MTLINQTLDIETLQNSFSQNKKIKISNILCEDFANKVYSSLHNDVPWNLMFFNHDGIGQKNIGRISASETQNKEKVSEIERSVKKQAKEKFQYLYNAYDVLDARRLGLDSHLYVQKFLDFVGSDELFDFISTITNNRQFNRVDCHACRYLPGHFLREHGDESPYQERYFAYVFNFTKNWHSDFGGITSFLDKDGNIIKSWVPDFNSLSLFEVPTPHSVSAIADYSPVNRYSITGWFTRE